MRIFKMTLIKAIFFILLLMYAVALACADSASVATNAIGQVVWVKGTMNSVAGNKAKHALKRRDAIFEHDTILTDASGSGEIVFSDGGLMTVRPNSQLLIDQYRYKKGTTPSTQDSSVINVAKGGFRAITGAISKTAPEAYQIKTPVATIGVRGTELSINYIACSQQMAPCGLDAKIYKGSIYLQNKIGQVVLTAGTSQLYARVGSVAQPPAVTPKEPPVFTHDVTIDTTVKFNSGSLGAPLVPNANSANGGFGHTQTVNSFCIQ